MTAPIKQLRINGPRPTRKLQPIDSIAVFDSVDFWRWSKALTHSALGQLDQPIALNIQA
jgi:hypothetical protein